MSPNREGRIRGKGILLTVHTVIFERLSRRPAHSGVAKERQRSALKPDAFSLEYSKFCRL